VCGRESAERDEAFDGLVDVGGEEVGVWQGLAVRVDAEECAVVDGGHADLDGVLVGQGDDRVDLFEFAAEHEER
jgi:hypothetical protein